ncbi:hypothetical protein GCM10027072_58900 [Streptomyces bullii]
MAAVSPAKPPPTTVMRCMTGISLGVGIGLGGRIGCDPLSDYEPPSPAECDITDVAAAQTDCQWQGPP